ncbi:MAG: glycosyltransferase family 4 protein [Candidatus Electrothrix sp. YB6]
MTTILFVLITACLFTLAMTPLVGRQAVRFGLTDAPSARKIHTGQLPRAGGVALFSGFFFPFLLLLPLQQYSLAVQNLFADERIACFAAGAGIIFLLGLLDDIRGLSPLLKLAGQILVALLVYFCGFRIAAVTMPFFGADFSIGLFALPVTVFWLVLVINAINLIDGLDGLAAGICLFVSLAMLFVCIADSRINAALAFAALVGTLIGFLRYNFHPASIFMGDCGSYFLGYCLAALSLADAIKGQMTTAMLIPVIALGVPLFDTLWAPLRRLASGRNIFLPDNRHIHHRLVRLGYTHRRAVLVLYAFTILLGLCSLVLVHSQNDMAALILFVLGIGVIGMTRYLCASDLISWYGVSSWFRNFTDEAGISGISMQRRSFYHHQRRISGASEPDALWNGVYAALEALEFDYAEFRFVTQPDHPATTSSCTASGPAEQRFSWTAPRHHGMLPADCRESWFRVELPLNDFSADSPNARAFGSLLLLKDMSREITEPYILKRVEQLRRSMISALRRMAAG